MGNLRVFDAPLQVRELCPGEVVGRLGTLEDQPFRILVCLSWREPARGHDALVNRWLRGRFDDHDRRRLVVPMRPVRMPEVEDGEDQEGFHRPNHEKGLRVTGLRRGVKM